MKTSRSDRGNRANEHNRPDRANKANEYYDLRYAILKGVTAIAFVAFCFLMLPGRNSYMLRWYDEMSFFEPTRFFFRQMLCYPGGLLRYAGAWLTQLMYYPMVGCGLLTLLWVVTAWLTQKGFRLTPVAFPLAFVVPMAMLVSIVQMDDAWLSIKSAGYIYSNTLGYLFAVAILCLYRLAERRQALAFLVLLATSACYFIAGFYAIFAAFIGIIFMVADSLKGKKYVGLVFAGTVLIAILIVPNLYYSYFQSTTVDNDYLYLTGLPDFLMEAFDAYLWIPFIAANAFLLVIAFAGSIWGFPSGRRMMWASVALIVGCGVWCMRADRKNEQVRATALMLNRLEKNDWEGMARIMSRLREPPSYTMRVLNNLAITNLGGEGAYLGDIQPRNIDPRHSESFNLTAYVNIPINYYNGNFNVSYRWAMEHNVQYGKRVFFLKYMIKSALLNGEIKLAKRYNDLLLRTMFHRKWAEEMNRYIEDPSLIKTNQEFKRILEPVKTSENQ